MSILEIIFNKTRYHRVPPCPRCESKKTGRFIYVANTRNGVEKIIGDCMARGELVRVIPGLETTQYENAYCENCGVEWHANIETFWLPKEAIAKGVHAGKIIKTVTQLTGGNGGGKPDMAQGGGKDASKIDEALAEVENILKEI